MARPDGLPLGRPGNRPHGFGALAGVPSTGSCAERAQRTRDSVRWPGPGAGPTAGGGRRFTAAPGTTTWRQPRRARYNDPLAPDAEEMPGTQLTTASECADSTF